MADEMQEAAGAEEAAVARELAEAFMSEEPNEAVFRCPASWPGIVGFHAKTNGTDHRRNIRSASFSSKI